MDEAKLKPCPFCGGEATVYAWGSLYGVACEGDCFPSKYTEDLDRPRYKEMAYGETKYEAMCEWNRRYGDGMDKC